MKRKITSYLTLLVSLFMSVQVLAQAPQAIPYQAVVRNNAGNVIANKTIGIRFGIRDEVATGTLIYLEEQKVTTNALGLLVANVGQGTLVFGYQKLDVINWQRGEKFLEVEIDTTGGTTYKSLGTQKLMSVPYALSAGDGVPVGTIVAFGGDTTKIPQGWVLCDGRILDRKIFGSLFTAISINWGVGDGTTTFNVPDLRGKFIRGVSYNSGYDPDADARTASSSNGGNNGNKVGSYQGSGFASHDHNQFIEGQTTTYNVGNYKTTSPIAYFIYGPDSKSSYLIGPADVSGSRANAYPGSKTGGNETRPVNSYVNYIIKY